MSLSLVEALSQVDLEPGRTYHRLPAPTDAIDQGDILDGCPILLLASPDLDSLDNPEIEVPLARVLVVTQTCDLAHQKATYVVCAVIHEAQNLVEQQTLKAAEIRGQVRMGRVFGWYYLPASAALDLPEMIVDFRQLHTVRMDLLTALCPARPAASAHSTPVSRASRQALRRHLQPYRPAGTVCNRVDSRVNICQSPRVLPTGYNPLQPRETRHHASRTGGR